MCDVADQHPGQNITTQYTDPMGLKVSSSGLRSALADTAGKGTACIVPPLRLRSVLISGCQALQDENRNLSLRLFLTYRGIEEIEDLATSGAAAIR
jgi:hypothetical protein